MFMQIWLLCIPVITLFLHLFVSKVGMTGLQSGSMLMPSDMQKQPQLPQHDWAEKELYITPSAHCIMEKESTVICIGGYQQLTSKRDTSLVTVRPKCYGGSSCSTWASDYMQLRCIRPDLFEVDSEMNMKTRKNSVFPYGCYQLLYT